LITLHSFSGLDGANPITGLGLGRNEVLYGITENGGSTGIAYGCGSVVDGGYGCGTVFSLTPPATSDAPWTEAVLYSFTSHNGDGVSPDSILIGPSGAIYGTTFYGGSGYGTVFRVAPPAAPGGSWTEAVLYRFTGGMDGAYPVGIVRSTSGALYITASRGGATSCAGEPGCGTILELTPPIAEGIPWNSSVLYSFTGLTGDGWGPDAGLVVGSNGVLYGTTQNGGVANAGTVFSLTAPALPGSTWIESVLYTFTGTKGDGTSPNATLTIADGSVLYGTAGGGTTGLGVVFSLAPPATSGGNWTESILYSFRGGLDGSGPEAGLILGRDGALFGTTIYGGLTAPDCPSGCGTVFRLSQQATGGNWVETVLYRFQNFAYGYSPISGVIGRNGDLYGTTWLGGNSADTCVGSSFYSGCGTVFKLLQ
jgi:uncharacterized repeat protein (TIGR03803 family)